MTPRPLGERTWPEVDGARPLLLVPVGSCEQHGPHLPLDTDTRIAVAVAEGAAARVPGTAVTPAVAVGASGEHAGFPGTLSIGTAALTAVLVELCRSADWARGVVLVNGHGGNTEAVRAAAAVVTGEGRQVLAWWPAVPGGDAHAGRTETSILLALAPDLVRSARPAGRGEPIRDLLPALRASGVRAVSPNGVLGDAAGAHAAEGAVLLAGLVDDLVAAIDGWVAR